MAPRFYEHLKEFEIKNKQNLFLIFSTKITGPVLNNGIVIFLFHSIDFKKPLAKCIVSTGK